jgi:CheY-like chemotaxis protein
MKAEERPGIEHASATAESTAMNSGKLRVLIVDDNLDYTAATSELLHAWGYCVKSARSGREALALADSFRPRVVILDLGLPDMHGYELAKRFRQAAGSRKLHFIVTTGWMQIADQLSSNAAGIAHHLIKPVSGDVLKQILAAYQAVEEVGMSATA